MTTPAGAFAPGLQQAALFIDADNFSDAQSINAAWAQLKSRAGRVSVCRAYGSAARLQSLAGVWRSLGARTIPNLALDKNTTDAALVADAVALHFQQEVRIFAIASGDADFAPLAVRLREWGCEVWCFSIEGILFQGAQDYYDRVVRFSPQPAVPAVALAPPAAAPVVRLKPANLPVPVPTATKPVVSKSLSQPIKHEEVTRILNAVPELKDGPQPLSQVVPVLRKINVLGKTTKATAFFARLAAHFMLSPVQQPTQLIYIPPPSTPADTASKAVTKPVKPVQKAPEPTTVASGEEVLSWPAVIKRQGTPSLVTELHALRAVLGQLATLRVSVADVLLAVPEMLEGQPCALGAVAGRLREKRLLRPSQSALRVLERHPRAFAVQMDRTPQTVRYLK